MLVTLADILKKADKGNYAVVAPDYTTMNSVRYQLEVAEKFKSANNSELTKHMRALSPTKSFDKWARIILDECNEYNIDACLHLDHGTPFRNAKKRWMQASPAS